MKFVLRTVTPVHVGNGESLAWIDYHVHGNVLQVFDWGAIIEAASLGCEDVAERLVAYCDRSAELLREAEHALPKAPGNERAEILRRVREQTSPLRFAREDLGNEVLARAMRAGDYDRYRAGFLGGRLDRRLEIRAQAKDAQSRPVIPASALRGQIRSALLHVGLSALDEGTARRVLGGGGGLDGWDRALADATPGRARFLFGAELESAVFRSASGSGRGARADDPRTDLMQFVRISDPLRARAELVVLRISPFTLHRSTAATGPTTRATPLQPVMMEAIDADAEFEYEIGVDALRLKALAGAPDTRAALLGDAFWNGFARLFGLAREEVVTLDPAAVEQRVLSAIEVALSARATALLGRERRWFDRIGLARESDARAFVDGLEQAPADGVPLRIGWGSGLLGLTALSALESDAILSEPLGRALARAGLGLTPRARRERAEREKAAIERARQQSFTPGEHARLRGDLLAETRDPKTVPFTRRLVMVGASPAEIPGFARFRRGELSAEPPPRRQVARAAAVREEPRATGSRQGARRDPRDDRRDKARPEDKPPREAPRREAPRREAPRRDPVPDRPATQNEIDSLLKRFGPRHS